jgi:hypothetical protein
VDAPGGRCGRGLLRPAGGAPALQARDEPQAASAASDSVLVLDVNPSSAGWAWMPLATLIRGMRSLDTVENRGYVLVGPD